MTGEPAGVQPPLFADGAVLLSDAAGDVPPAHTDAPPRGLLVADTRYLSRWSLRVDGATPRPLSGGTRQHLRRLVLVPPSTRDVPVRYTAIRAQAVDRRGLAERLTLANEGPTELTVRVRYAVAVDLASQFEMRSPVLPRPGGRRREGPVPGGVAGTYRRAGFRLGYRVLAEPGPDLTVPAPDEPGTWWLDWNLTVPPQGRRTIVLNAGPGGPDHPDSAASGDSASPDGAASGSPDSAASGSPDSAASGDSGGPAGAGGAGDTCAGEGPVRSPEDVAAGLAADAAAFTTGGSAGTGLPAGLRRMVRCGLADLAALRMTTAAAPGQRIIAAGIPWFQTLFGRDSLLTGFALLRHDPAVAAGTLRALAALQGRREDPGRVEEPGKIVHEVRVDELSRLGTVPYGRYYGSVDATPLFLVLLGAHREATGDDGVARELEPAARAAVAWMYRYGGLDRHGWLVYPTGSPGLVNHCWKDSARAICFRDGRPAAGPVAVCEAQGYAYDALRRTASLAAEVWHDAGWARRLRADAGELRRRFVAGFWLDGPDFPALARDGSGRRVDALASNAGHLLWSGLLDADRAAAVARRLAAPEFFTGWGIRTLAAGQPAYHPLSYHNGSVWPHDTALAVAGMRRYGHVAAARTVTAGLIAMAEHTGGRLPEVVAGYGRDELPWPVPYPHSCSPQAWAAAAPLLLAGEPGSARR